ncbi:MAG: hypothetical protein OEY86_00815 [Nitrospira sp.]|nr:hypothetical protein [Nitrospira sp.]
MAYMLPNERQRPGMAGGTALAEPPVRPGQVTAPPPGAMLAGNPGPPSAPPPMGGMPRPNAVIPAQPVHPGMMPNPPQLKPQAPKQMSFQDQERAYRRAMRQQFPDMDEKDFEMHVQYGIAKQRGRMAAQRSKELTKPFSRYMSELAKKDAAEMQYQMLGEKLKSRKSEFLRPDGTMDPGFAPYKDQLDAARLKVQKRREKVKQHMQLLNKLGVKESDISNPVTMHEFMRSLASGDPKSMQMEDDDTDLMDYGDEE